MLVIAGFIGKPVMGQITLEHTYDSAYSRLYMVKLEVEGYKYVYNDGADKLVKLFNLDHSIFKIMDYSFLPNFTTELGLLYISEHLFNSDNLIEYMLIYQHIDSLAHSVSYTYIINEVGNVVFSVDSGGPFVIANAPQIQVPIYNTPNGTKMILSIITLANVDSSIANVYSLPGILTDIAPPINYVTGNELAMESIYPNPSNGNTTTIEFHLPHGENKGEIVIYNLQGMEQKRYEVDNTFHNLIISNSELHSGTYFYQLLTNNGATGAKKMVVVK